MRYLQSNKSKHATTRAESGARRARAARHRGGRGRGPEARRGDGVAGAPADPADNVSVEVWPFAPPSVDWSTEFTSLSEADRAQVLAVLDTHKYQQ